MVELKQNTSPSYFKTGVNWFYNITQIGDNIDDAFTNELINITPSEQWEECKTSQEKTGNDRAAINLFDDHSESKFNLYFT